MINDLGGGTDGSGSDAGPAALGRRRDRRRRRFGRRQHRRRQRLGRCATSRAAGRRRVRPARRLDQQRRHPPRPDARQPVGGRVGRRDPRQRQGPRGAAPTCRRVLARAGQGARLGHRGGGEHVVAIGTVRQRRPVELRRRQAGGGRADHDRRQGARPLRRAGEHDRTRGPHAADGPGSTCADRDPGHSTAWIQPTSPRGSRTSRPISAR